MIFRNRRDAGRQLAARLARLEGRGDVLVLGIPRGGILVADEIAQALGAPLDVFITRKIGAPFNPELAIGAVASDGTVFLDRALIYELGISDKWLAHARASQMREIQRRLHVYRGAKPAPVIKDQTVVLTDDGIATGATVIAALRALGASEPSRLVLAIPVAPPQVVPALDAEADELVILHTPEPFRAVGYFYEDFEQVTDEEVVQILSRY